MKKKCAGLPVLADSVAWKASVNVRTGDCFIGQEGKAHPRENRGYLPVIAIVICMDAHIGND